MSPAYAPLLHPLDSIDNLRDLGGRPAADGRPIKKGLLFRSAELSHASREDLDFLERAGIAAVADLRDADEREARPDRLPAGAVYHHLPVLPLRWAREDVPDSPMLPQLWRSDVHRFFVVFYRILASSEETADMYASFIRLLLLRRPVRPTLWHCTQGKDRAGIASILVHTALGVSWEGCLEDYFLTNRMMRPRLEEQLAACRTKEEEKYFCQRELVQEDCIEAWLTRLTQKWGGLPQYLHDGLKLGDAELEQLRDLYLE
ncbi:MAG: tyrosine-protein phosphatase [Firmicutes bacterium]|nr:tyrosine-protein phosphatase [Bacillota bacterium]